MDYHMQNLLQTHHLYEKFSCSKYSVVNVHNRKEKIKCNLETEVLKINMYNKSIHKLKLSTILSMSHSLKVVVIIAYDQPIVFITDTKDTSLRFFGLMVDEKILYSDYIINYCNRMPLNVDTLHFHGVNIIHPVNFSASQTYIERCRFNQIILTYNIRDSNNDNQGKFNYFNNMKTQKIILNNGTIPLEVCIDIPNVQLNSEGPTEVEIGGSSNQGLLDFRRCEHLKLLTDNRSLDTKINDYLFHSNSTPIVRFNGILNPQLYINFPKMDPYCTSNNYGGWLNENGFYITHENVAIVIRDYYPIDERFPYNVDYSKIQCPFPMLNFNDERLHYEGLSISEKYIYNIKWWRQNAHCYSSEKYKWCIIV